MISEWFSDALRENGHSRIDNVLRTHAVSSHKAVELLRKSDYHHILHISVGDRAARYSNTLLDFLRNNAIELGPWTSFLTEGEIPNNRVIFAFKRIEDAVYFKLLVT